MSRADLLDFNVPLALAHVHYPHHTAARRYWEASTGSIAFCRTSMQGFLRLVSQPAVMGAAIQTLAEAWSIYTAHRATGRSVLLPEPENVDSVWQRLSSADSFYIRDWKDSYLASFALCADCRLVSFDAGFSRNRPSESGKEFGKTKGKLKSLSTLLNFLHLCPALVA